MSSEVGDGGEPATVSGTDTADSVAARATESSLRPPATVGAGRYRLGSLIGRGGSGEVFRARDTMLERPVAIKLFPAGPAVLEQARLWREVRTLAGLNHSRLVAVYDVGKDRGRTFFVMQLVEGSSLAARLSAGPLPLGRTVDLGGAVASGLAYVHRHGVVHRDLKPANVLLDRAARPYLCDFGEAARHGAPAITDEGLVRGTASYLAPEQVRGEPVGPKADVYSLALVLLECLSGHREYPGDAASTATARLHHPPDIPARLPDTLASVLRSMTDPRADRRPDAGSLSAYFAALSRSVAGDRADPAPATVVARSFRTGSCRGVPGTRRSTTTSASASAAAGAGGPVPHLPASRSPQRRRRVKHTAGLAALLLALGLIAGVVGVLRIAIPFSNPTSGAVAAGPSPPAIPAPLRAPISELGAAPPAPESSPGEDRVEAIDRDVAGRTDEHVVPSEPVRVRSADVVGPDSPPGTRPSEPTRPASVGTRHPDETARGETSGSENNNLDRHTDAGEERYSEKVSESEEANSRGEYSGAGESQRRHDSPQSGKSNYRSRASDTGQSTSITLDLGTRHGEGVEKSLGVISKSRDSNR